MPDFTSIDFSKIASGVSQGIQLANLLEENRRNKILEHRQNLLFEQQQKQYELEQENQNQYMKSEQLMQQKMQEAYDQNTGRIDLKKISEMYGFVKPEVFQKYSDIAGEHNANFEAFDKDKIQDQIDLFALDKSRYEAQAQAFDIIAGKLKSGVTNPMKWQAYVNTARQNGLNIPEGIEALQTQQEREQFLRGFIDENTSFSQQQKNQLADYERNLKEQAMKRSIEDDKLKLESETLGIKQKKLNVEKAERELTKKEKGRPLTDTAAGYIQQAVIAAGITKKLNNKLKEISELKKGPITGSILSKNPYDAELREIENYVNMLIPSLGRGVFREVGVMTDKDIDRYKRMISSIKTDPKVATKTMNNLMKQIDDTFLIYRQTYKDAGFDLSGFEKYNSVFDFSNSPEETDTTSSNEWQEIEIDGKKIRYRKKNK